MINNAPRIIFLLFLSIAYSAAYALPEDNQKPLKATSDQAEVNQNTLTAVYRGNVHVTQGSTSLNSQTLTIKLNQQHQVESALAEGQPATYITTIKAGKAPLIANAKSIQYFPLQHQVVLKGDAHVTQEQNSYDAQILYYDTLSQVVSSPKAPGNRSTIIIQPQQQAKP